MSDVTRILNAIERGEAKATDELLPLVYEELRLLAAQKLSHERPGQTLQATALVHEAYIRLVGDEPQSWENRGHFFAAAAEAMRRILIDHARHRQTRKCGGGRARMPLDDAEVTDPATPEDIVALDDALAKLAAEDPQAAEIVKLRLFAGLSIDQAAEATGVSRATAYRQWTYARAWLRSEIQGEQ
ncbi:MAG: sigma-70 family RNA polymerase sigma factor [Planctomycetes bacterium]|nr:sigma-70 family RNA polymerase sigma factor [Planctomycetota bacterium]